MKLGGSVAGQYTTAVEWAKLLEKSRFAAVTSPVNYLTPAAETREYQDAARSCDVTIAEVGVWKNPLAIDARERRAALEYAKGQLAFADAIGADCCVNIVGSKGGRWDGAYPENFSQKTYEDIVSSIREIIDDVKPQRTFYTIEPMPWMVPDGPDEYLQLIRDVDRERFGVHMDFVNMINSARRFLFACNFIEECFAKLAPYIKSCHCKDIVLEEPYTLLLRETAPGKGMLDYHRILRAADSLLPKGIPFLLEHMQTFDEYAAAYDYLANIAVLEHIAMR